MLFNETRHYNINIFYKIIFLKYKTRQIKATEPIKISNSLICFCSFDLSCPILEKDNFIEFFYIVTSCLIKYHSFLTLSCFV